jgi:hypothetical protein
VDVDAAQFLISGRKLVCLACDSGQSLHLFSYELHHPDTWRGKKLLPLYALAPAPHSSYHYLVSSRLLSNSLWLLPC